jgi:hypothetical protein
LGDFLVLKRAGLLVAFLTLVAIAPAVSVGGSAPLQQADAACRKAPDFPVGRENVRFGIGLSTSDAPNVGVDLKEEERRFGTHIPVVRTWDTGMPRADAWKQRSEWFGQRWVVTSIKLRPQEVLSGRHDSALRHYFDTAPTKQPIFFSYFHEPEDEVKRGEFTPQQFRQAFRRIIGIAAEACNPNLYPTLVLMSWTAEPASGLDWRDYYPGKRFVSVLGWDPYNGANGYASSYRSPQSIFGDVVRASRKAGKPFGVAETGSVRIPGDSSGTGRAAWLRKVDRYLTKKDAAWVTYFQSTNKGDFELRDAASIAAWREAMN